MNMQGYGAKSLWLEGVGRESTRNKVTRMMNDENVKIVSMVGINASIVIFYYKKVN